ncbi:MAG: ATP-binding protein [Chloroflexota bacterium]
MRERVFREMSVTGRLATWVGRTPGWVGYALGAASALLANALIGLVLTHVEGAELSIVNLIPVLAVATAFGSRPAVAVSVLSFLTYDWFFVEPLHSLTVAYTGSLVSLFVFLITAIVTGQLAGGQRARARQALQREREAVVLADVVRDTAGEPFAKALDLVADRVRRELGLLAVRIDMDDPGGERMEALAGEAEVFPQNSQADTSMLVARDNAGGAPGTWVRLVPPAQHRPHGAGTPRRYTVGIRVQGREVGAVQAARRTGERELDAAETRLLYVVAVQLGSALERLRLRREATAAEVLRRTDTLKSSLLNAVSHDLRTPLVSIMAAAGSLLDEDIRWSAGENRQFAEAIEKEAGRLDRLVGNLLDLSRIEAGSLRVRKQWQDLETLVEDVVERLRPITARHRVTVALSEDLPPVPLDYVQIDQVLSNLIDNSAKYSPEGTEISISAGSEGNTVRLVVANRSPAIPADELGFIFEPFYRLESVHASTKGSGLGLAVARALVEAHGGRIWAESDADGTRFIFTLPLTAEVGLTGEAGGER